MGLATEQPLLSSRRGVGTCVCVWGGGAAAWLCVGAFCYLYPACMSSWTVIMRSGVWTHTGLSQVPKGPGHLGATPLLPHSLQKGDR